MKALFILLFGVLSFTAWSQETAKKEYVRLYYIHPDGIGNNVIAKANEGRGGVGVGVTVVSFDNIFFIIGLESTGYGVTDKSLAGNVSETNMLQFYNEVLYKIPLTDRFTVNPEFGLGVLTVGQRMQGQKRGSQEGLSINPGFTVDYSLGGNFRVFAGLQYSLAFLSTKTNDDYKSFFGTIQTLNIVAGIKL